MLGLAQVLGGAPICCILWSLFGFSVVFGDSIGGVIGNPGQYAGFGDLFSDCYQNTRIPTSSYAMFQMMFASIAPLLITGAYAGRLSIAASLWFTALWEVLVYYPVAHWMWGDGWLRRMGAEDFAGGIVLHTTAGAASVICAMVLGRRGGFEDAGGHVPPSSLALTTLGGGLLCTGWFGFTAGCVVKVDVGMRTAIAIVNTQLGAAASALVWIFMTWRKKRPTIADILNGAIAGLAGITPCAGFVYPWAALIIAIVVGASSFEAVEILRFRWGLDDALDVSSVHGVTGIVGSIAIAFAANTKIGGHETGLVYGVDLGDSAKLLGVQLLAVVVTGAYSAIVTYGILKAFKRFGLYPSYDDLDSDEDDHYHGQRDSSEFNLGSLLPGNL